MKRVLCTSLLATLMLTACGGGSSSSSISQPQYIVNTSSLDSRLQTVGQLRPAVASSPYASILVNCVQARAGGSFPLCSLAALPLLGQNGSIPSKNDILQRTVVSNDAITTRFSELLDKMPTDIFKLFRGVTAIVIANNISPSFYSPLTGTVYLDAESLQPVTNDELRFFRLRAFDNTEASKLAFRVSFGLHDPHPLSSNDRAIQIEFASLLFHELAHANDFMPPAYQRNVVPSLTVAEQIDLFESQGVYTNDMHYAYPLKSKLMEQLAEVIYDERSPTQNERNLSSSVVSIEFAADGANDSYNFHTPKEDAAMLFEELMLKYHFNVDRAFAITSPPAQGKEEDCSEYKVQWGSINRVNHSLVKHRAKLATEKLLGISNASIYFQNMPNTRNMSSGVDFCTNLDQLTGV